MSTAIYARCRIQIARLKQYVRDLCNLCALLPTYVTYTVLCRINFQTDRVDQNAISKETKMEEKEFSLPEFCRSFAAVIGIDERSSSTNRLLFNPGDQLKQNQLKQKFVRTNRSQKRSVSCYCLTDLQEQNYRYRCLFVARQIMSIAARKVRFRAGVIHAREEFSNAMEKSMEFLIYQDDSYSFNCNLNFPI